ncbi:MAG: LTA synthase family protein, partial [Eubacterium sp.]|nr:LTA synthase family protein [Eubacterium sp.]
LFDITELKGLKLSGDPLPNIHRLSGESTSGRLTVPVYGAGTINTEFEVLTGMNTAYFGTGEYPYRSILHKRTSESTAYWLKDKGYNTTVIHNNNASFYDRDYVLSNLGFDNFISSENMNITSLNEAGWSKDAILEEYILDTMKRTKGPDYIYAISVQGHGDYPDDPVKNPAITVENGDYETSYLNTLTYYVNQIYEMDQFIGRLTETLSDYGEETILVFYGDHLPSLNIESKDLVSKSKYKTSYVIWDNYGYNSSHRSRESADLKAYQLSPVVLDQLGIHNGVMNEYHQEMRETKNYKKNMKLLQYDLLYGSGYSREGEDPLEATKINYCLRRVKVEKLKKNKDHVYVMGRYFTDYSRVYVNGSLVNTRKLSDFALMIRENSLKDGDELVVHQVSKTHPNITFNTSNPFYVDTGAITSIDRNGE